MCIFTFEGEELWKLLRRAKCAGLYSGRAFCDEYVAAYSCLGFKCGWEGPKFIFALCGSLTCKNALLQGDGK